MGAGASPRSTPTRSPGTSRSPRQPGPTASARSRAPRRFSCDSHLTSVANFTNVRLMSCSNPMHEDRNGNETCNGTCPDDRERCKGCEEPTEECACEDVTAEIPAELAREVVAVSEAEAVRRQFRAELVKAMANAEKG